MGPRASVVSSGDLGHFDDMAIAALTLLAGTSCALTRMPNVALSFGYTRAAVAGKRAPLSMADTNTPLFSFEGDQAAREAALEAWERIDDVIMGGVSSSRLVLDKESGAVFEGRLREQGGGFCGQRMRLLAEPLDLSAFNGLYLDCDASDVDVKARVLKAALRTRQDRGEVVYQAAFKPAGRGRETIRLPFNSFRLVRGPRLVPGVPPLTASMTNETYQISLVISKFEVSDSGAALSTFREGPFSMRLFEVGAYSETQPTLGTPLSLPTALTDKEQAAAQPALIKLLRPLLGLLFGETTRRRRAATLLLQSRGSGWLARAKLAFRWRMARGGVFGATWTTATVVGRDMAALAISLPVRLLFRLVVFSSRALKWVLAKSRKGGPQSSVSPAV